MAPELVCAAAQCRGRSAHTTGANSVALTPPPSFFMVQVQLKYYRIRFTIWHAFKTLRNLSFPWLCRYTGEYAFTTYVQASD